MPVCLELTSKPFNFDTNIAFPALTKPPVVLKNLIGDVWLHLKQNLRKNADGQ